MNIKSFVAGSVLGAAVVLPVSSEARSVPDPVAYCFKWQDQTVQQCNLYFNYVRHTRVVGYVNGQWMWQDDSFYGQQRQ